MKQYLLLLFCCTYLLSGCDSKPTLAQICKNNPEICNEFNEDSWCKKERISVGISNYAHITEPNDLNKFNQLIAYEDYAKCVSHSAKIEHIKLKGKKTKRIDNMMKAKGRVEEISKQTEDSEHPRLLYFHWTRYLNEEALNKFLALEGTKALETPESQYELATYYTKIDLDKTLQLLFHALELYKIDEEINDDIFKSLSSIFAQKEEAKQAYIWIKVLSLYDPEDPDLGENSLNNYVNTYQLDQIFLDQVAEATLEKVLNGTFVAPKF